MFRRTALFVVSTGVLLGLTAVALSLPSSTPPGWCRPDHPHFDPQACAGVTTTTEAPPTTIGTTTTSEGSTSTNAPPTSTSTTTTSTTTTTTTTSTTTTSTTTTTTTPPTGGLYGAGISGAAVSIPADAVIATPATLASLISSHPAGTAFALQPGTYVGLFPNKAGNQYYGSPANHQAVVFDGQTTYSSLTAGNPGGSSSLATSGHEIAFNLADDNIFANMTFRRYRGNGDARGQAPLLAVGDDRVIVRNVEFKDNQFSGLRFGGVGWRVSYITSRNNGQYCVSGSGTNHILENSLFDRCGVEGLPFVPRYSISDRGVSKINHSNNFIWRNSEAGNISGGSNGIWFDTNNFNFLIEGNYVHDVQRHGIIVELGEGGTIRGNVLVNVAYGTQPQAYRDAGIFNHYGGAILIEDNTIDGARNGIILYQPTRDFDPSHGDSVCGSTVRRNTVTGAIGNAWLGIHVTTYEGCHPVNNPSQVTIQGNIELGSNIRYWLNGLATPQQWAAKGFS